MAIRRTERVERGGRERRSDGIMEVFRSKTKLRLENKEKNVTFNATLGLT